MSVSGRRHEEIAELFREANERFEAETAKRRARDARLAALHGIESADDEDPGLADDTPLGKGISYLAPAPADSAWIGGRYVEFSQEGLNSSAADLAARIPRSR
jgi:hypothetical protein